MFSVSMMRSRNYKLLTKLALIMRLAGMSSGKSDHTLSSFLGIEVSKDMAQKWMAKNYKYFKSYNWRLSFS